MKWSPTESNVSYKKSKNKCNSLTKKAKKIFFKQATKGGIISNKKFSSTVKPFLYDKDYLKWFYKCWERWWPNKQRERTSGTF